MWKKRKYNGLVQVHLKIILFCLFIVQLFFSACKDKNKDEFDYPVILDSKKAAILIEADNKFAFDIFKEISDKSDQPNLMISPVSISIALGMAYNGAEGTTRSAFKETMRMSGFSSHEINSIHGGLIKQLKNADPKVKLEIANAIWLHNLYTLEKTFTDTSVYYYDAGINSLDFFNGEAEKIMNQWVSDNTHGKIPQIIDRIPPLAVAYLMNALYFHGTWTTQFDKENSGSMNFIYADGSSSEVKGMQIKSEYDYYTNELFSAIDLPYGDNKFSMTVFLPADGKTLEDFLSNLNYNNWNEWISKLAKTPKILLQMPKFKTSFKSILNEPLKDMGLGIAFTEQAEFPGIVQEDIDLHISEVVHKTYIDVNEEGTEAAAVTSIGFETTSAGPSSPVMIVNRPFFYAIREKTTGALVFMGRVGEPEYDAD